MLIKVCSGLSLLGVLLSGCSPSDAVLNPAASSGAYSPTSLVVLDWREIMTPPVWLDGANQAASAVALPLEPGVHQLRVATEAWGEPWALGNFSAQAGSAVHAVLLTLEGRPQFVIPPPLPLPRFGNSMGSLRLLQVYPRSIDTLDVHLVPEGELPEEANRIAQDVGPAFLWARDWLELPAGRYELVAVRSRVGGVAGRIPLAVEPGDRVVAVLEAEGSPTILRGRTAVVP